MNNTFKHTSDDSQYKTFNPVGTKFASNITNVQAALAACAPFTIASETVFGSLKIATQSQVDAGVDDTTVVTPKKLAARLINPAATTTTPGLIRIATNVEADAGTVSNAAIVPSSLLYVFNTKTATEAKFGTIKIANNAAAIAGTDDTLAMTPLKVKQAIANATSQIPSPSTATETRQGIVQLATSGQVQQGTLRDGYAISPYALSQLTSNASRRGLSIASTLIQANAGTDDSVYISAKGFKTFTANLTNTGTVKLTDTLSSTFSAGVALSSNAKVLSLAGGTLTGDLTVNTNLDVKGAISVNSVPIVSRQELDDYVPIGTIIEWNEQNLPNSKWSWYSSGSTTSRVLIAKTVNYTGAWMTIPLASVLQSNESFLNTDLFTLIVNPEQPHEAWSIHRDVKEFRIQVFNRSGTNRIGYNGVISFVIYKNQASSSNKIIRVQ
ncbi:gp12 short tail fibers [Acinetobacter phage Ac42]|uniref:tail collar fiber protein n=1 Tax=Acinetobacter phage Ac42 TaxID=762660 RepID=UPI0001EBCDA4|nr:tail collar fiber protein [Acinetobacter phage Ac42]ADI96408.1 gp12 short tail fibers [Acinetobacter phage Ac42]